MLSSVIQNSTSSDIKSALIFFLFVLQVRTGNDPRDQADLASARSVTIGSWFSDCIGASGSLIVVGSWGSTSTKSELSPLTERSGTPALSSGIRFPGWSVVRPYPSTLLSLALSFNNLHCWICVLTRYLLLVALCFFSPSFFLPCFSPLVTSNSSVPQPSSLFFSFGYVKKTETKKIKEKKENERERIEPENKQKNRERKQSGCLISVVFNHNLRYIP